MNLIDLKMYLLPIFVQMKTIKTLLGDVHNDLLLNLFILILIQCTLCVVKLVFD